MSNPFPPKTGNPFPVQAAKFSLYVPIVLIILNVAITAGTKSDAGGTADMMRNVKLIQGILSLVAVGAGFLLGIISLLGIPTWGASRILPRAIIGILFNGLILFAAIMLFFVFPGRLTAPRIVDKSLSLPDYITRGIPAADHPWRGADYKAATTALTLIGAAEPNALPRWKSAISGLLFDRITAEENLTSFAAIADVRQRLPLESEIGLAIEPLTKVYAAAAHQGASYDDELVEILRYSLQWAGHMDTDIDAFMATIPKSNPRYPEVARQFQTAKDGIVMMVQGTIDVLADKTIRKDSLTRFARDQSRLLPPLIKNIPPDQARAMLQKIQSLRDAQPPSDYKSALADLATILEPTIK